jgi:hypothetical protein
MRPIVFLIVLSGFLLFSAMSEAQNWTGQDLVQMAQDREELALQRMRTLRELEASYDQPLWMIDRDGDVVIDEADRVLSGIDTVIELVVSMRVDQGISRLENSLFELPAAARSALARELENAASLPAGRIRQIILDAYLEHSRRIRGNVFAGLERELEEARALFEEGRALAQDQGRPETYRDFDSTYGVIYWSEGWYGDENKRLSISSVTNRPDLGGWLVEGDWWRANDEDYRGGFAFLFGSPCVFSGTWWYEWDGRPEELSFSGWSGSCVE